MYSSYTFHPQEEFLDHGKKLTTFNPVVVIQHNFTQTRVDDVNILNHIYFEYLT